MSKQIAKREVGLGLNISEFAKSAKTAEELLDKITQGRTISLDTKLNLGDAQAVLQKILDQKTVSIRTALDVKDLMSIMEKSIADFEQRGSTSLARMNRRFLEEFQTGLGSVNFKLDDGTLIGGYQKAIEQANKLNLLTEQQGKTIDTVTTKTEKKTRAIQQETKATEKLAAAQEKVTAPKKRTSKVKVREFTREEYDTHTEKYEKDNDGNVEFLEDTVDIIRQASQFGVKFAADITTSCKRATTAVNRFFSAINPEKYPALASWKAGILESIQNGYFSEVDTYNGMSTGSYSWGVEEIGDGAGFYVYLNTLDVAKDKEKEYSAYLTEEFKKRDEGLEKQNELTRRLIQTYEKLNELHVNEPSWDKNNEVESIKRRLEYYEQEKALLQDIQNLKEEFSAIPGRYVSTSDFNEVLRVNRSTLRLGDYGSGNLKDNERAITIYQAQLERAIKRQEKAEAERKKTEAVKNTLEELREQRDITPRIGDDMQDSVEEALRIVPKNVKQALDQLRGAIGDPKKLIDLSGVFSEEDLESQISELVKAVNGTDLEFDSVHLFGDTAQIQLSNKALGLHVTQLYQLKEATEDATEATLQFIETSKVSVSGKEQESYISTRQKAMDSAEKWLINAQKKLNTQKRNYQNSQKKIAGDTLLLDADSTTLEANVDATIDGLVSHIQKRIQENLGKVVSEDVKNQITRDLNALENEIKIQQLQKYTNTTMSASEVEAARKSIVNMLDTLASKARTNNVFDQIAESYNKLRQQLTDNTIEGYIQDNFTDAINQVRVIKSELTKAIALEGEEKPFRQMEESMKSARSEIDTSKEKLNSLLETFGHVEGMDAARKTLDDMTAALELFNEAQDKTDKKAAYDIYDNLSKQFEEQAKAIEEAAKAQQKINDAKYKNVFQSEYRYNNGKTAEDVFTLDSMSDYYKQEEEKAQQFSNNLKSIYSQLISTVKQINNIDVKINDLAIKDGGSGLYSKVLESAQSQKSALVSQLRSITDEINKLLNISTGESGIQVFLDTAREKAILTEEEIQKLVDLFSQSENIQFNFTAKLSEQIQPVIEKIASLKQMMKDGIIGKDTDISKSILNIDSSLMSKLGEFKQDPSAFNATQVLKYVDSISKYINVLDQAAQKEQQYFASKQKYTRGNLVQQMADDAAKSTEEANSAQQKLTAEAQAFAKELGANGAIVTKFVQDANGISKLDFSVLKEGTNEVRSFTMAMGSVTDGFFFDETTAQKSMSVVQSANNQLSSMLDILQRLKASGIDMNQSGILQLVKHMKDLDAELKKPIPDETELSRLAKDAKISQAEVEKLYKKHLQLQDAIDSGNAKKLGNIDLNGNVYKQLTKGIQAFAKANEGTDVKIGNFNKKTGELKFTMNEADDTVKEFTVSLDRLGKVAVIQETGVKDLGSKWDRFKASLSSTGKQLMTALVGYNVFFKAISEIRKGINYVKEIDLAMTELKKVTDETEASYRNFINTASDASSQIGSTVSDFTEATANFARLGYTMEESADMAKTAIVYKNVAD